MPTPTSRMPDKVDSKFRFVLVAARRAEQLMQGARVRLESPSGKKSTRIAQEEVRNDLVTWDFLVDDEEVEEAPEAEATEEEASDAPAETDDEVH